MQVLFNQQLVKKYEGNLRHKISKQQSEVILTHSVGHLITVVNSEVSKVSRSKVCL